MSRIRYLAWTMLLGGLLALVLVLLLARASVPSPGILAAGPDEDALIAGNGAYTVHVPLAMRQHLPGYVSSFGVVIYGNVDDNAGLQVMRNAGARWATTALHWSAIERSKGVYTWSSFDLNAQNAQAAGVELHVLFTGNPPWAAALPGGPVYDLQDLVDFVTRMAERYDCDGQEDAPGSPCVDYWSFYAEPDNRAYWRAVQGWGYWGDNPEGYAQMLQSVSPAIHAANPRAKVLIGGLAYEYADDDSGTFARFFLPGVLSILNYYPGGADAYIDALAFHFYPISPDRWPTIRDKALEVRRIMTEHGVGDLPLICPEGGYWSSPLHGSSEQQQAQRLVQMYVRSLSVDLQLLSWYKVFDAAVAGSPEDTYPDRTSGLLRLDGSRKPSYHAYHTVAEELHGAQYSEAFQYPGVEGYVFRMPGNQEKTVLWATGSTRNVPFAYACVRVVDIAGGARLIQDGDPVHDGDGSRNGQVSLWIDANSPLFAGPCP